jgi:DNA-binding NtrC family response regulator
VDIDFYVRAKLAASSLLAGPLTALPERPGAQQPEQRAPAPASRPRRPITQSDARAAVKSTNGNIAAAARKMGVSRPTVYKTLGLHEIPYDKIVQEHAECGGDIAALEAKLGIPADLLLLRLRNPPTR